ncbi:toxin-activating lysine-acyltransferase [Acinetobacter populi]|uniref:RTX toxin-activating lysine-acyltransferase n=1 Tax=Acinetobacter populi TaxID=1582270 RepID=A0A1Z9YUJ0_9GAMM|nr:toxin-activating lysine-acyltransferase [Acinetobacter populi]OUY05880.1 toxin-activating lysine-acyltransferase [Acinetobacter populi]
MKFKNIDVIAPTLYPTEMWNEAEVFGAITWLWLKSDQHKLAPIERMSAHVLPVIKNRQFALFSQGTQPLAYVTWAYFSPEDETRYIASNLQLLSNLNWDSGNRMWIIDWFAPLGHSFLIKQILETYLFPNACFRSLYHKGDQTGLRIKTFRGKAISYKEQTEWMIQHPITYLNL